MRVRRTSRSYRESLLRPCLWYDNTRDEGPALAAIPWGLALEARATRRGGGAGGVLSWPISQLRKRALVMPCDREAELIRETFGSQLARVTVVQNRLHNCA